MISSMSKATALLALAGTATASSYVANLSTNAQGLLNESMAWMDQYYDRSAGYLYDFGSASALRHETRSSVWYALGLLARNNGDDAAEAEKIITNTIAGQFKVESEQWYGDYQKYDGEPYVGSENYPGSIYNSWDPNWRGFVGTTLIMALEEFPHLLSNDTQDLILASLHNTTKGDEYRVGGVDDDNLYPAYSNPAIMRALVSGYTGRKLGDANMTQSGENYAQEIIDLFDRANTLSEFNSGTYTGVSLFGLILWSKYLPEDSVMTQKGPQMLTDTWKAVAQLWNPSMKNMAGPWDRAYGYDMNRYVSLMALWFWTLIGKENSSLISAPQVMSHAADYAWAPLFAVLADYHQSLLPEGLVANLTTFSGDHFFTASTYYPPYDYVPRNITSWLSENLTIGAESFNENVIGGPSENQASFNPAVIQWNTGNEISFISLYPTEMALDVAVEANKLTLTYPNGTADSIFSFVVGTFIKKPTVAGWADVQGLNVSVSGNINETYALSFAGEYGGSDSMIRDFEFWNFTYSMPAGFEGAPTVTLDVTLL
ncbi:hypothetical protein CGCSCA5_v008634 [Colletotrichum siamense]|uniref:Uncharacterized protein n=1 Tax=Colletotrichum chrysophilum TaxID=1836956 RepID=A0AAD9EF88_9PEZI|nr:uncharacterized protein COL26b_013708 [Colletotrichum chrysophilum]KAF4813206.1 hypothetical protein CGCSCA5_v008634 [Colletotrichum siamense]KAI8200906.1 hypothetical protein KHU50_006292 [Colletotrichum sp. SAR 10_65]KAI8212574.1 hypothetical protein K4K52_007761 [Colletotrichum sp. SAR 10_76]KAJ0337312.1 hypothetical protein KNSL1_012929 [Colletotrichum chrysophilum]KAJ0359911.1 hypothetical protein COL154_007962 [Colletotrichum chrysophilum]